MGHTDVDRDDRGRFIQRVPTHRGIDRYEFMAICLALGAASYLIGFYL